MKSEYRLVGRLEAGELAELFRATRDGELGVVVKLFHARTTDLAYAREAAAQARAASQVLHPGVVQVIEIGLVNKRLAIVRQDVGGYTLGQALQRLNTKEVILPHSVGLALVIELLEIVQRAHEAGVVHGAITPGNVLLTKDGRVGLCDFGALRALHASPELRRTFAARGRSSYKSPEVHKGEPATPLSDIYSLGCIAYELLTLREVSLGHALGVRHHGLPPPSRLDRRINTRLDSIVMRALEGPPNRRFKSCGEMAEAIREFLASQGGMPPREDIKRFVTELFPTEGVLSLSTHVPIAEPFRLSEVEGAELEPVAERSMVLESRPSFSGGFALSDEQTDEAPPVFPEAPSVEARRAAVGPPPPEEGTHPRAEPAMAEWEAPPGEAPKPKKGASSGGAGAAILKRVRRIEDFSAAATPASEPPFPPESIFPSRKDTDEMPPPLPAPTEPSPVYPLVRGTDGQMRKMVTEERRFWQLTLKKRRMGLLALAIAVLGAFVFTVAVWRSAFRSPPLLPPEPIPTPPKVALPTPLPKPVPQPKPPPDSSLTMEQREEPIIWHTPPRSGAGFLTIEADRPAIVYVDGQRVRKTTPLRAYPVAAGTRKIAIVEKSTGVRREYTLNVQKGQTRKLQEMFGR